ncbi:MAG: amidohydrolase family protein [Bacilli bacterium]|nr:amidohydrolase family protein [Bacilli bacterium]MBN2877463.1 amidohydrolase family protein [Bacilli bacterium]
MYDLRILNGSVYRNGVFEKTNIYIQGDTIKEISKELLEAKDSINVSDSLVLPALIDPHVHFNLDLGRIRSRDDFLAGSIQAAFGGVTTIIDFLNPVDNIEDLQAAYDLRMTEAKNCCVDYQFHATIKNPKCDLEEFVLKMKELGMHSLKLFTTYSDSGRRTYDEDIIELLKLSEKHHFLLLAHIENDDLITLDDEFTFRDLNRSRPNISETKEALKLASYVRDYGGYLYMVHLSSGYTIEKLKDQYGDILNKRFFVESCPHYFTLTSDEVQKDDGYLYTLAPPLRSKNEMCKLRDHFDDIYAIGTDHCAFFVDDKNHYLLKDIPLGIGGIEYSFDLMYKLFEKKTIDKMSKNLYTLYNMKDRGSIEVGKRANLFVYDLMENTIDDFHGFTDYSVYKGCLRKGRVIHTIHRGKFLVRNMNFQYYLGTKI